MTDKYAVIGNPIAHSKSPQIHAQFAKQTGEDIEYTALLAPLDGFEQTVREFFSAEQGGKGLNVTVPFKQEAWELCNELSDYAKMAGAVNTLVNRPDGTVYGANTDGIGIVRDLEQNHNVKLTGKKILILGAGGAVRGVLQPILDKTPKQIFNANRTASKAVELATLFKNAGNISGGGYDEIPQQAFDIIINGTAASLAGDLPPVPDMCVKGAECCYDMMYSNEPTAFVKWAQKHGVAKALDGLGMLVEQAAESFYLWRGVRPETPNVITSLR